jgi:anti-anti-sigma factor
MQGQMYATIFKDGAFDHKTLLSKYTSSEQAGDVIVIKFGSEITFLSVSSIEQALMQLKANHTIIFSFSHVDYIDLDGVDAIDDLMKHLNNKKIDFVLCGLSQYLKDKVSHLSDYQSLLKKDKIYYASAEAIKAVTGN